MPLFKIGKASARDADELAERAAREVAGERTSLMMKHRSRVPGVQILHLRDVPGELIGTLARLAYLVVEYVPDHFDCLLAVWTEDRSVGRRLARAGLTIGDGLTNLPGSINYDAALTLASDWEEDRGIWFWRVRAPVSYLSPDITKFVTVEDLAACGLLPPQN